MRKIDLKSIIENTHPVFNEKSPKFFKNIIIRLLERILHVKEINEFLEKNRGFRNIDFIDELFEYLEFSYSVSSKDRLKIPAEGKLIIISNHPLGALDGLSLIKVVSEVRPDVKIVANDLLVNIENLSDLFLPYDLFSYRAQKRNIERIHESLENDEAVIIFPAAEVSRLGPNGIKDSKWRNGAVKLASALNAPVLPVCIDARNSMLFYLLTSLNNGLGLFLLPHEMFNKRKDTIELKIGNPIPADAFNNKINTKVQNSLLKKHLYKIGKGKKGVFITENTIIHPVNKKILKKELNESKLLGITKDRMSLFLTENSESPNVVKEISRLREITFRKVGEGTGKKKDTDVYDNYYKHLVLWDEKNLEIAGSYRLGECDKIIETSGIEALYSYSLYNFNPEITDILKNTLELGRSFIQHKYWRTRALDYIWQGIGAYLIENPTKRYLFGAVSISDSYSEIAKSLIIYYYTKWYSDSGNLAVAKEKYTYSSDFRKEADSIFTGTTPEEDFRILKTELKNYGCTVPVLFRKYTELCEYGGVKFLDFGIDSSFNSVDGLILVDLEQITPEKRKRYYESRSFVTA